MSAAGPDGPRVVPVTARAPLRAVSLGGGAAPFLHLLILRLHPPEGEPPMAKVIVQQPRPGQNYGPGREPASVRDAWDKQLQGQREAEQDAEAEAS
jgi:hypothetical protein